MTHLCCPPQWAVVWEHSTVASRSSVSSVLLVRTRTQWVSCPVSRVPALKDRAMPVLRMFLSVEVTHHPIITFIEKSLTYCILTPTLLKPLLY